MRALDRLKCIQGLIDKQLKQKAVAERLGLTVRQVRRLVERYKLQGPRGFSGIDQAIDVLSTSVLR